MFRLGDRVVFNTNDNFWNGHIGTITGLKDNSNYEVVLDGMNSDPVFSEKELSIYKTNFDWNYGDNGVQEYYDTTVNGKYLLVFRNHADKTNHWMCSIDDVMIENKTRNNYYRNKKSFDKVHCILSGPPFYLLKKIEYCFKHNTTEISA